MDILSQIHQKLQLNGTLEISQTVQEKYSPQQILSAFHSKLNHLNPFMIADKAIYRSFCLVNQNDVWYPFQTKGTGPSTICSPLEMKENDTLKIHLKEYNKYEIIESNLFYCEITFYRNGGVDYP